jgi:Na+-driven multidrug efflux pump
LSQLTVGVVVKIGAAFAQPRFIKKRVNSEMGFGMIWGTKSMETSILGTESIGKLFLRYSVPTIVAMLFLGLNTIVDGLFVGRYIGAEALASVNIAMPFSSFLFAFSVVIGIGAQSLIGRNLGAGKTMEANAVFTTALVFTAGVSLLFAAIAVIFPVPIALFLGTNKQLMPQVVSYIRYLGLFLPFLALMMVLDYSLKVVAMPVYAMMALVFSVGSHMLFNWLFIAKFALGIKGAAFATGIAYMIAFFMTALPFLINKTGLNIFPRSFDKQVAGHILYTGASEGLSELGTGITTFLFNITLMRYVGEMGVAAFTLIGYLAFIGNNVLIGLSDGVGAIVSYNYGRRRMNRVKAAVKLVVAAAVAKIGRASCRERV